MKLPAPCSLGSWFMRSAAIAMLAVPPLNALRGEEPPLQLISITSPAYRAEIKGKTRIEFIAPALARVEASSWKEGIGGSKEINLTPQPIMLGPDGKGSFELPADEFPHGPMVVKLTGYKHDNTKADVCHLELFNKGGVKGDMGLSRAPSPPAAAGMRVVYSDDFEKMPRISRTDSSANYYDRKPDASEYGAAQFSQQGSETDPFHQTETWLRIRTSHVPDLKDQFNRQYSTGFISSLHEDGKGFKTKPKRDQYFECKLRFGAAPGMWSAFWLLSGNNHAAHKAQPNDPPGCDEIDILEGYGPWVDLFHTTCHEWGYKNIPNLQECLPFPDATKIGGKADMAEAFHTFGCLITEKKNTYYLDNVEYFSHPTLIRSWEDGNYFMINGSIQEQFLNRAGLINQAQNFSRYGGACDLWVDWVRVYQK